MYERNVMIEPMPGPQSLCPDLQRSLGPRGTSPENRSPWARKPTFTDRKQASNELTDQGCEFSSAKSPTKSPTGVGDFARFSSAKCNAHGHCHRHWPRPQLGSTTLGGGNSPRIHPESTQNPHRAHTESTQNPHRTNPESTQGPPRIHPMIHTDSTQSPHRFHKEPTQLPHRLHPEPTQNLTRVQTESTPTTNRQQPTTINQQPTASSRPCRGARAIFRRLTGETIGVHTRDVADKGQHA